MPESVPIEIEDIDLSDEGITIKDITLKSFLPLIAKRFCMFLLKSVGSRTMNWLSIEYITSIAIMYLFATMRLEEFQMKLIFFLFIAQLVFVLIMFGIVKFNAINTELKFGNK